LLKTGSKSAEIKGINNLYEFGPFRLDPARHVLLRGEEPVSLTPKAFETLLLLLLENRDRVLLKDELMNRLWPESFVEEANLSQTIFILRKTLGETAQDQRYIVTVRGTGYRFAEKVREVRQEGNGNSLPAGLIADGASGSKAASDSAAGSVQQPLPNPPPGVPGWRVLLGLALLGIAVVAGGHYLRSHFSAPLTEKDTVLLADFDNPTGDPVFDGTLRQALAIQLEQSPFLKVLSDQRLNETLKLMNRVPGERLTRAVALEVCQRENIKAVLAGSVASIGKQYLLNLEALNCESGETFASQQARSDSREGVLDGLSQSATQMRAQLGESLASIGKFDRPLRDVTTSSLEALKAFTSGAQMVREGRDESAAVALFERAIDLDPNFAVAYSYLAICYDHLTEEEKAAFYQNRAYALRDRVSEREKLLITSGYHWLVTGDTDKEVETYQLWREEYPRDYLPLQQLGDSYSMYPGQYEKAVELLNQAWQLEPMQPNSPRSLAYCYLALNRTQEARRLMDHALEEKYDVWSVHAARYLAAAVQEDNPTLEAERRWSAAQPATANIADWVWADAAQRGRVQEARKIAERQIDELRAAGYNEAAALSAVGLANEEALFGNYGQARKYATLSSTLFRSRANLEGLALASALSGDTVQPQKITDELSRKYPSDTVLHQVVIPLVLAAGFIARDQPEKAIAALEPAQRYEKGFAYGFSILYLRGIAHLKNHQMTDAVADFQEIIDHRGISPLVQQWVLAHLGRARAHATLGDVAQARSAYQSFFALLTDADPDIPILKEARAEYANLQ
jgi:DNA-binding winged helix-turn-helix (wHTH) protein/tetratricopeptide (TPR) repeat protein